jgi:hypothetical protein
MNQYCTYTPHLLKVPIVVVGVLAHDHYVEFCVVVMFPLTKNPVLLGDGRCLLLRILPFVPPIDLPSIDAVFLRSLLFLCPIDLPSIVVSIVYVHLFGLYPYLVDIVSAKVSFGSSYVVFFVVEFLLSFVEIYHFQTTPWMKRTKTTVTLCKV